MSPEFIQKDPTLLFTDDELSRINRLADQNVPGLVEGAQGELSRLQDFYGPKLDVVDIPTQVTKKTLVIEGLVFAGTASYAVVEKNLIIAGFALYSFTRLRHSLAKFKNNSEDQNLIPDSVQRYYYIESMKSKHKEIITE